MSNDMVHSVFSGWNLASVASDVPLFGGDGVIDVNVKVRHHGNVTPGKPVGDPFLVWAPNSLISEKRNEVRPADDMRLWQEVNRQDAPYMKSLSLFSYVQKLTEGNVPSEGRRKKVTPHEAAFMICALSMMYRYRSEVVHGARSAFQALKIVAKVNDLTKFLGEGSWETLPYAPKREIARLSGDGAELGSFLRKWHDELFSRYTAVAAFPIAASIEEDAPHMSAIDQGAEILFLWEPRKDSLRRGPQEWHETTRAELGRLIWILPLSHLSKVFGVSDVAIAKRCRQYTISTPPRGFWRMIERSSDAAIVQLLEARGRRHPEWWTPDHARRTVKEFELHMGKQESETTSFDRVSAKRILLAAAE